MAEAKEPGKDEKDSSKEATDAFKALLGRLGEIFGVFDFSFFVSGAVCFGALIFGVYLCGGARQLQAVALLDWKAMQVGAVILACYVLGIICFAAGRLVHSQQQSYAKLGDHLREFGLDARYGKLVPEVVTDTSEVASTYPGKLWQWIVGRFKAPSKEARKGSLLYTRLWAEVRQSKQLAPSFNLLVRYWVMAALCDGLAAALGVWLVLWVLWHRAAVPVPLPSDQVFWGVAAALLGAILLCFKEAGRYGQYQMYELVATLAYEHVPLDGAPKAPVAPAP